MKKSKKVKIERIEKLTPKQCNQLKGGDFASFRTLVAP